MFKVDTAGERTVRRPRDIVPTNLVILIGHTIVYDMFRSRL